MKSEASLRDTLLHIAKGTTRLRPIEWVVFRNPPKDMGKYDNASDTRQYHVRAGVDIIILDLFDLSIKGYYVSHVTSQDWGDFRELMFKIRKSDTHQTNITNDTIAALIKVLEPTLKGGN